MVDVPAQVTGTRRMRPTLAHRAQYLALRGFVAGMSALPLGSASAIGARIARLGRWPLGIRRRVVERQIAAAFPDLSASDVRNLARRSYEHLGRIAVESALLSSVGVDGLRGMFEQDEGWEHIERARSSGTGFLIVTGHIGNWELAGGYVAARGVPLDAVVRRMNNPLFDGFLNETRRQLGMGVVYDHEAVRRLTRSVRSGRAGALLADQAVKNLASTYVTFFGRPAKTPRGPAVLALRWKVPLLFVAALRQPSGKYRLYVEEVPISSRGDRDEDIDAVVVSFTRVLERYVRRFPEQYFWQHRRWKRQPPDTPAALRDPAA